MQVSGETDAKVVKSAVSIWSLVVKRTQKQNRLTRDEGSAQIRRAEAGWNQNETGLYKSACGIACTSKTAP